MAVFLSNGRNKLRDTFHRILHTFIADADYARGIFIKPNIVFPVRPSSGEITSPVIVKALISALRERNPSVDILIGEGVAAGCDPQENFRISGYSKLAHELDVPLLDLDRAERKTVVWKFGKLELPRAALERTYISLPILKPSSACVISGALKNQKGLVLPSVKKHFHRLGLHEQIAELNAVVRPSLTILDCSHFFGRNALIAGDNCGEIDATACQLLNIDEPDHVRLAQGARVFEPGFSVGGDADAMRRTIARPLLKQSKSIGRLRLWSNPRTCTMCRYLFHDIQRNFHQPQRFKIGAKLLAYSVRGAEVVMGSDPQWRRDYRTVICIGACTRQVAKEGGYLYIPGCPPTLSDLNENLP